MAFGFLKRAFKVVTAPARLAVKGVRAGVRFGARRIRTIAPFIPVVGGPLSAALSFIRGRGAPGAMERPPPQLPTFRSTSRFSQSNTILDFLRSIAPGVVSKVEGVVAAGKKELRGEARKGVTPVVLASVIGGGVLIVGAVLFITRTPARR